MTGLVNDLRHDYKGTSFKSHNRWERSSDKHRLSNWNTVRCTPEIKDEERILKMLLLYYPRIPNNLPEAIEKIVWFYGCGECVEEQEETKKRYVRKSTGEPAYSFSKDAAYIYAAFKEQYDIDLTEIQDLHWWKFKALFDSLNEETQMKKIMYYRKVSISGMDRDRRAYINEMKKLYSLSKDKKKMTLEQRNASWIAYVKSRKQK